GEDLFYFGDRCCFGILRRIDRMLLSRLRRTLHVLGEAENDPRVDAEEVACDERDDDGSDPDTAGADSHAAATAAAGPPPFAFAFVFQAHLAGYCPPATANIPTPARPTPLRGSQATGAPSLRR